MLSALEENGQVSHSIYMESISYGTGMEGFPETLPVMQPWQPQTCSHPMSSQTLTGVHQVVRMISPIVCTILSNSFGQIVSIWTLTQSISSCHLFCTADTDITPFSQVPHLALPLWVQIWKRLPESDHQHTKKLWSEVTCYTLASKWPCNICSFEGIPTYQCFSQLMSKLHVVLLFFHLSSWQEGSSN